MLHPPLFALHHPQGINYHLVTLMDMEELSMRADVQLWGEHLVSVVLGVKLCHLRVKLTGCKCGRRLEPAYGAPFPDPLN